MNQANGPKKKSPSWLPYILAAALVAAISGILKDMGYGHQWPLIRGVAIVVCGGIFLIAWWRNRRKPPRNRP